MRPWGGMEQLTWSPDSKQIVYTCRKKVGKEYAFSTNSDLYLYDLESKTTTNLSEGMMGYDQNPVFTRRKAFGMGKYGKRWLRGRQDSLNGYGP